MLQRYHRICDEVIAAHGGNVNRRTGDGVLALFGHPQSPTRTTPRRAVRAGLALAPAGRRGPPRGGARVRRVARGPHRDPPRAGAPRPARLRDLRPRTQRRGATPGPGGAGHRRGLRRGAPRGRWLLRDPHPCRPLGEGRRRRRSATTPSSASSLRPPTAVGRGTRPFVGRGDAQTSGCATRSTTPPRPSRRRSSFGASPAWASPGSSPRCWARSSEPPPYRR